MIKADLVNEEASDCEELSEFDTEDPADFRKVQQLIKSKQILDLYVYIQVKEGVLTKPFKADDLLNTLQGAVKDQSFDKQFLRKLHSDLGMYLYKNFGDIQYDSYDHSQLDLNIVKEQILNLDSNDIEAITFSCCYLEA